MVWVTLKLRFSEKAIKFDEISILVLVWEHSHMASDVFGVFLTYLPTLIRYYRVKSDAA